MHYLVTSSLDPEQTLPPRPGGWLGAYVRDCRGLSPGSSWASRATPSSPRELSDRLERKEKRLVEGGVGSAFVTVWSPSCSQEQGPRSKH